ncbi:metal-dependent hydrolase [Verrucomicrobiota bacterium]
MPSPVAHLSVGFFIYRFIKNSSTWKKFSLLKNKTFLITICFVLSVLPDMDFVPGFFAGNVAGYHNNWSHSLIVCCFLAVLLSLLIGVVKRRNALQWFWLIILCCGMHVVMDYFTWGRGVKLFWPFLADRYIAPFIIFRGVRWSEGFFSIEHVWTVLTELIFVFLLFITTWIVHKRGKNWSNGVLE